MTSNEMKDAISPNIVEYHMVLGISRDIADIADMRFDIGDIVRYRAILAISAI
jgi:hypothetical protein